MSQELWQQWIFWFETHETLLGWLGLLSILMFLGSLFAVPMIIVALPRDFLFRKNQSTGHQLLKIWYIPYLIVKNIFGFVFTISGIAMLVLPGQGILTIIIGLSLVNFPRKRRLIRRILGNARISRAVNRIRGRFNRPPLEMPD